MAELAGPSLVLNESVLPTHEVRLKPNGTTELQSNVGETVVQSIGQWFMKAIFHVGRKENALSGPDIRYCPGEAELAAYIAMDRDDATFRRFDQLSARNLVVMQCDITALEQQLLFLDKEELSCREQGQDLGDDRLESQKSDLMQEIAQKLRTYRMFHPTKFSATATANV